MGQVTQRIVCEEMLDKTMQLFWKRGFFNTSIEDVVEATGFNRAAIYKYFGGKEGLFLAMLKRYRDQMTPQLTAPLLHNQPSGIENIKTFFSQFLQLYQQNCLSDGCFLIATASDLPSHHQDVAIFIKDFLEHLRQLFRNRLEDEQKTNKLISEMDVNATADFLVGNVFGLMTLFRSDAPYELLKNHINGVMNYLSSIPKATSMMTC